VEFIDETEPRSVGFKRKILIEVARRHCALIDDLSFASKSGNLQRKCPL